MSVELKIESLKLSSGDLAMAKQFYAWLTEGNAEAAPSATPARQARATPAKKIEESTSSAETATEQAPSEPETSASEQVIEGSTTFDGDIAKLQARCLKLGGSEEGKAKLAAALTATSPTGKWSGVTDHAALHAQLEAVGA